MYSIQEFVNGLCRIDERDFTLERVDDYLRTTPVDPESLAPYLVYTPTHYTRNLIHKSSLFELMAICWDVGQVSRVHNHAGQDCWMAVPVGRLVVQNYEIVSHDPTTGHCELREADRHVMDPAHPCHVLPERPIHAVLNPAEYAQRATSLHVYSHPYDHCLVYSLEKKSYGDVPLFYDTEFGRPATPR
jgi:predicted metal-dependent enzyme (double-stranded beta helix superfamily)